MNKTMQSERQRELPIFVNDSFIRASPLIWYKLDMECANFTLIFAYIVVFLAIVPSFHAGCPVCPQGEKGDPGPIGPKGDAGSTCLEEPAAQLWVRVTITNETHDGDFSGVAELQRWVQKNGCSDMHVCTADDIRHAILQDPDIYLPAARFFAYNFVSSNCATNGTLGAMPFDTTEGESYVLRILNGSTELQKVPCSSLFPLMCCRTVYSVIQPSRAPVPILPSPTSTPTMSLTPTPTVTSSAAPLIERVSVGNDSVQGNGASLRSSVDHEGRFVVFDTTSTNFALGDSNGQSDVYVRDRLAGTTHLISKSLSGSFGDAESRLADAAMSITADGNLVAFFSSAANLVSGDTNGFVDIFIHDRRTEQTIRVSVNSNDEQGNGDSRQYSMSRSGQRVVFGSQADNIDLSDSNGVLDVYLRDVVNETTIRISLDSSGQQFSNSVEFPVVSADGGTIAFVGGGAGANSGVHRGAVGSGLTTRIDVDQNGITQYPGPHGPRPSISGDGRFVVFDSLADHLVPGDTNNNIDIFLYDHQGGNITRVSVSSSGEQANGGSGHGDVSEDGRYVVYNSVATNLVDGDTNNVSDVFLYDRLLGTTRRLSENESGEEGNDRSEIASFSGNAEYVVFYSRASNLVPDDTNGMSDIFIRKIQ